MLFAYKCLSMHAFPYIKALDMLKGHKNGKIPLIFLQPEKTKKGRDKGKNKQVEYNFML